MGLAVWGFCAPVLKVYSSLLSLSAVAGVKVELRHQKDLYYPQVWHGACLSKVFVGA